MISHALPLKRVENSNTTFYVPESTFRNYVKQMKFPSKLAFGTKTVTCRVAPHPNKKQEYLLSSDLWNELSIPYENNIHLTQKDDTLFLGPLVGIFTAGFTQFQLRPIGERSLFFAKLLAVEEEVGAYYFVFGTHNIDWEQGVIQGYFYRPDGWKQFNVPLPNVVYDRLPNRKVENLETSKLVKDRLQKEYDIPWFNPGFFHKWDIQKRLMQDKEANNHLPESYYLPSYEQMEHLLETYQHLYIKPANGSLGIGIQQLFTLKEEPYVYCRFRDGQTNRLRRYSSLKRLLKQQFPYGIKDMIAQRGIDLIKFNRKPIDFRVHTNKNKNGEWVVSAIAAKIAGEGSITTHVKSGGEVKAAKDILKEIGCKPAILKNLKSTALLLSEKIDRAKEGFIGEIGFDLGVDESGHVWMFEANSKPGRTIFSLPKLKKRRFAFKNAPVRILCLFVSSIHPPTTNTCE
ncbi:MAG: YheC/YheD family protein [Bacillaceae bacterium]|nr:YheC/YheD family protein [Bacillaceae bacterium]